MKKWGGDLLAENRGQWLSLLDIFGLHVRQEMSSAAEKQLDFGEQLSSSNLVVTYVKCILESPLFAPHVYVKPA